MRIPRFVRDEVRAQREDLCGEGDIRHDEYRALVVRQAVRDAGNRNPSTRHFWRAQKKVNSALGMAGVTIAIPGARPGRRTI
jgi:hypothetical protein